VFKSLGVEQLELNRAGKPGIAVPAPSWVAERWRGWERCRRKTFRHRLEALLAEQGRSWDFESAAAIAGRRTRRGRLLGFGLRIRAMVTIRLQPA